MDVLSDVLLSVRLTGAVFFAVDARSPFVTESPSISAIADHVVADAENVIAFHVVTEGTCWAETIDHADPPVSLEAGDMVAFPGGDANVMASAPGMRGRPDPALYVRPPDRTLPFTLRMSRESTADRTRFVCGFLGCDTRPFNPLLDSLPRIVHSPVSEESRRWVTSLLDAAVQTSGDEGGAGREAMLAKLAELMFVEALRSHVARLTDDERGWLAGVRDPQVGAALRLMHGRRPIRGPWSVWLARSACRGHRSPSDSPTTCASRRCSTSPGGGSSLRPGWWRPAPSPSRRQLPRRATSPKPPSTARSSERSEKPPEPGAVGMGAEYRVNHRERTQAARSCRRPSSSSRAPQLGRPRSPSTVARTATGKLRTFKLRAPFWEARNRQVDERAPYVRRPARRRGDTQLGLPRSPERGQCGG